MSSSWAIATAARIARRAAKASRLSGRTRGNPFTDRGLPDLADAWQQAYDEPVTDPGPPQCPAPAAAEAPPGTPAPAQSGRARTRRRRRPSTDG